MNDDLGRSLVSVMLDRVDRGEFQCIALGDADAMGDGVRAAIAEHLGVTGGEDIILLVAIDRRPDDAKPRRKRR